LLGTLPLHRPSASRIFFIHMTSLSASPLRLLPHELLVEALTEHGSLQGLGRCSCACQELNSLVSTFHVWPTIIERQRHQLVQQPQLVIAAGVPALIAATKMGDLDDVGNADSGGSINSRLCASVLLRTFATRARALCHALGADIKSVWPLLQAAVDPTTQLIAQRELDTLLMCCIYVVEKAQAGRTPDPPRFIFRDVIVRYLNLEHVSDTAIRFVPLTSDPTPADAESPAAGVPGEGDVIAFYNTLFVPQMHQAIVQLVLGVAVHGSGEANDNTNADADGQPDGPEAPQQPEA